MEKIGTPLGQFIDEEICWGIKTGLNDAFIIDEQTREEILQQDRDSIEIIKPLVTGSDIRNYQIEEEKQWIIYTHEGVDIDQYTGVKSYLSEYRDELEGRATKQPWYELQQPQRAYSQYFEGAKILYPEIAPESRFAFHPGPLYPNNKCFLIPQEEPGLAAFLNSSLSLFYLSNIVAKLEGGAPDETYYEFRTQYMQQLPVCALDENIKPAKGKLAKTLDSYQDRVSEIFGQDNHTSENGPLVDSTVSELFNQVSREMHSLTGKRASLNLSLRDHLGSYSDGRTLANVGLTQPPEGSADSILQQTTEQKPNLRVGEASVERESPNTVEIRLTARYKPDDEDANETDQWGYTETEALPALRITDLTETEADLIEAFVPVAVDEAGGFADFRETATKTNSLVDRLRKLTLPAVDDVRAGLESYTETVERAEELEAKIERTDDLIDEIVYELYGLTDEEIEIVEETVAD
ncbi:TaqI-like C-terminal specificity domain-containing protein [Halobacterium salinarum]|uniref:TaqI-like C-terminal specificity domain-containing protein n=1 Tax=Halobacterium salinarum TaxID=2242 RepID=UPI003D76ECFE